MLTFWDALQERRGALPGMAISCSMMSAERRASENRAAGFRSPAVRTDRYRRVLVVVEVSA